jgi:hypothetical protein
MVSVRVTVRGANVVADRFRRAAAALVGGGKATVGNSLYYAPYVHDGQPAHIISARPGSALYWEGAAHPVQYVNHPGYHGNPYLADAADAAQPEINALFGRGIVGIFGGGLGSAREWTRQGADLILAEAQQRVNVKTGDLLHDLHTSYG